MTDVIDKRRALLAPQAVAKARVEYVVSMQEPLGAGGRAVIHFVPDRFTLAPSAFAGYAAHLLDLAADAEAFALTMIDDIANELVCRWLRVRVDMAGKTVIVEDRHPGWSNDLLLSRLP